MTLTEAAFWTKRFGVIVIVFVFVVFIILFFLFRSYTGQLPPEYLEGNFACTDTKQEFLDNILTIPALELLEDSELNFNLETVTGKYDDLPRVVNVYRYTNLGQILNSQAEAKVLAKKMGFDPDRIVRRGTAEYIWVDNGTQKSLSINARDLNFTLKTSANKIRNLRKDMDLPSEADAIASARSVLRSLGVLDDSYDEVQPSIHLIDINPDGTYSEADSLINAELIRVDFHRKIPMIKIATNLENAQNMVQTLVDRNMSYEVGKKLTEDGAIETYNFSTLITYQNPVKSNISVYIGPKDEKAESLEDVYQIEYRRWDIEPEPCGTYELVPPSNALQRIQNGEGSLVLLDYAQDEVKDYEPQTVKRFNVFDIFITYYESTIEQLYLQPIYMITGEAELKNGEWVDFHIYYPAISYETTMDKRVLEQAPVEEEKSGFL